MPIYRAQFTVNSADNVPANAATNTWHLVANDDSLVAPGVEAIRDFYLAIDGEFSTIVRTTNGLTWKVYDLSDPEPRQPVLIGTNNLTVGTGDALPPEVAICLSFQAAPVSGVPQARRRNRVYLPYIREAQLSADGRPAGTLLTILVGAADTLWDASEAATSWQWVGYSPTDAQAWDIDNGWMDNEWDTQRRRGRKATSRTVFPP